MPSAAADPGSSPAGSTVTSVTSNACAAAATRVRAAAVGQRTLLRRQQRVLRRPLRRPRHHHRRVLLQHAEADLLDLVAERRGALELELLGGGLHLGLHLRDQALDLGLVRRREVRGPPLGAVHDACSSATARSRSLMSWMPLMIVVGSMPCSRLYASWTARRRSVSSIATRIDSVTRSAYITTSPPVLRAARPIIWISDHALRRKPSLSASRIATSVTSGRSRPSRSRLIPTRTSYTPRRRSRRIATRSSVSTSLWRYWTLMPSSLR